MPKARNPRIDSALKARHAALYAKWRRGLSWTHKQAAEALGKHPVTSQGYEHGRSPLSPDTLKAMALVALRHCSPATFNALFKDLEKLTGISKREFLQN